MLHRYKHKLLYAALSFALDLVTFFKFIFAAFQKPNSPHLRILIFHEVADEDLLNVSEQLKFLKKNWDFISPKQLFQLQKKEIELSRNALLVTFDDGFLSCKKVAAQVLAPLDIKAIFFVIPDFVRLANNPSVEDFVKQNILLVGESYSVMPYQWAMGVSDISSLISEGHYVGNHTKRHRRLSELSTLDIDNEITLGAEEIKQMVSCDVKCFAWPFGNIESINKYGIDKALETSDLVFSGIRGKNYFKAPSRLFFRDAIDPRCPPKAVASILEGMLDLKYRSASNLMRRYYGQN